MSKSLPYVEAAICDIGTVRLCATSQDVSDLENDKTLFPIPWECAVPFGGS